MKTILFNLSCAQPSSEAKYHGGGEYVKTVFAHLVEKYSQIIKIYAFYNPDKFLDEWILELSSTSGVTLCKVINNEEIYRLLHACHFDVLFTGLLDEYAGIKFPADLKKIGTLHDFRELEAPIDSTSHMYFDDIKGALKCSIKRLMQKKYYNRILELYKKDLLLCDEIVCVSNHTYYALIALAVGQGKRRYLAYTPAKHYEGIKAIKGFTYKDFILLVSANRWVKNCYRAIKALDDLYTKGLLDRQTVLTGNISKKIRATIQNPERFTFLEYVDNDELEYLYSECALFLYPSLNEGFGMPPLEAMRYGKTCVVSGICSMPEICGDAVYYCDPYKVSEIEAHVLMALENPKNKNDVITRFNIINDRQLEDLDRICCIIAE